MLLQKHLGVRIAFGISVKIKQAVGAELIISLSLVQVV